MRVTLAEGYEVEYNITDSWDVGVQGEVTITNKSPKPIEAWTLSFDSNVEIGNLRSGRVLESSGNSYTIASEVWTNPIPYNGSTTVGFTGTKESDVEAILENFVLTAVVIGEGGELQNLLIRL